MAAFPQNGVFDDFDRAPEGPPPSEDWTTPPDQDGLVTDGNFATPDPAGVLTPGFGSAGWNTPTAADCELYCTVPDFDTTGTVVLTIRADAIEGDSDNNYAVAFDAGAQELVIDKNVAGVETILVSGAPIALANGDGVGVRMIGNSLRVYHQPSGTGPWIQAYSLVDNSIVAGGYLMVSLTQGDMLINDVGGGTYVDAGGPAEPAGQALTPILLHVLGSHRSVLEDVLFQGEGERVIYAFDFSRFGVVTELIELTVWTETSPGVRVDVSGTVFDGDFEVVDTLVICPRLQDLDRDVEYRVECSAVAGGQTVEPYVTAVGEE